MDVRTGWSVFGEFDYMDFGHRDVSYVPLSSRREKLILQIPELKAPCIVGGFFSAFENARWLQRDLPDQGPGPRGDRTQVRRTDRAG
jgi:hypothetical protein